ncbi:MAG TPA: hypothetical protein DDW50_17955 [Firmicutes bacterium]|jgi:hypothetical protein|nr:hypothetical protein [Bacillota bacterium]
MATSKLFDIISARVFLNSLEIEINRYKLDKEKSAGQLLYIIMGLNHLREWISEGYTHYNRKKGITEDNRPPQKSSEYFYEIIWNQESFRIINELCNFSKHHEEGKKFLVRETESIHIKNVDEWEKVSDALNFGDGPVKQYLVNGKDIIEILEEVLKYYQKEWFANENKSRLEKIYQEINKQQFIKSSF